MLEINFTIVLFSISFLVFVFLLNFTLFKPVGEILEKRKDQIEGNIERAQFIKEEASKSLSEYEATIKTARIESIKIIEESTKQSNKIKQDKINELVNSLQVEKEKAIQLIESEYNSSKNQLANKIKSLTDLITNKVIGESNLVAN